MFIYDYTQEKLVVANNVELFIMKIERGQRITNNYPLLGFMKKIVKILLLIIGSLVFLALLTMPILSYANVLSDWGEKIPQLLIGVVSLILTTLSFIYLWIETRNGDKCYKFIIKRKGKEIAEKILEIKPQKILILDGNALKLFNIYVIKHLGSGINANQIIIVPSIDISNYNKLSTIAKSAYNVFTSKLAISINLSLFNNIDDVLIFDDVTFTGESIEKISDCLKNYRSNISILSMSYIVDNTAYVVHRIPSYHFKRADIDDNYRFPWR